MNNDVRTNANFEHDDTSNLTKKKINIQELLKKRVWILGAVAIGLGIIGIVIAQIFELVGVDDGIYNRFLVIMLIGTYVAAFITPLMYVFSDNYRDVEITETATRNERLKYFHTLFFVGLITLAISALFFVIDWRTYLDYSEYNIEKYALALRTWAVCISTGFLILAFIPLKRDGKEVSLNRKMRIPVIISAVFVLMQAVFVFWFNVSGYITMLDYDASLNDNLKNVVKIAKQVSAMPVDEAYIYKIEPNKDSQEMYVIEKAPEGNKDKTENPPAETEGVVIITTDGKSLKFTKAEILDKAKKLLTVEYVKYELRLRGSNSNNTAMLCCTNADGISTEYKIKLETDSDEQLKLTLSKAPNPPPNSGIEHEEKQR